MEKAKVEKWLNRLARALKTMMNTKPYGELQTCTTWTTNYHGKQIPAIHIFEGLHEASELLGLELDMYQEDDDYRWYGMIYNNVLFYQLDRKDGDE